MCKLKFGMFKLNQHYLPYMTAIKYRYTTYLYNTYCHVATAYRHIYFVIRPLGAGK